MGAASTLYYCGMVKIVMITLSRRKRFPNDIWVGHSVEEPPLLRRYVTTTAARDTPASSVGLRIINIAE